MTMANEDRVGDEQAGLRHYLDVVRRRKWTFTLTLLVAIGAAAAASFIRAPVYEAETKIVVGQGNSLFPPGVAFAVEPFTATMGDLVTSNVVAERVISGLRLRDETPASLMERISVSINPETAVMSVRVRDRDREQAIAIGDEIGVVFSELVEDRFGTPSTTEAGTPAQLPLTATIFDPAHADDDPVAPRPVRDIALAALLGAVLGLIGVFLREHFDRKLRNREAVERAFGVPVIGQIPFARKRRRKGEPSALVDRHAEAAEAFRGLRANLQYLGVKRPLQTILVTSPGPMQGKTTVCGNLALAISRSGASVAALEGDLRRPLLADTLGVSPHGAGLTSVLVGQAPVESALVELRIEAGDGELAFLPSGPLPPNPAELLSSRPMGETLDHLRRAFDYVLIDSPPLLLVADALELARVVDGVVLAARQNQATTDEAAEARALLERLDINLVGVVLTDVAPLGAYYGGYAARAERQPAQPAAANR